ncbi:MAG: hypothetical protein P9L94_07815 [Candidatus Hinthialibacter antarcticus]|nr:hypothetical protein [Candidatus Hinthialibacter antarcticus]
MQIRRDFLKTSSSTLMAGASGLLSLNAWAQEAGDRPAKAKGVTVLNPRNRVPLSFIIDDSTCLVNLAHFGIPHFKEAFPERYKQDWRSLPREIPDDFVRKFGGWCSEHGVKGKYSIVPYPACVGWMDRDLPGWSKKELDDSIKLVKEEMTPNWDIHPEMISHTWVINTKTGRPYPERTEQYMENFGWTVGKSVDELANYMSYALQILHNIDLPCEGITTPGGFGNRVLPELAQATLESCRDVYQAEIPHYFRHLYTDERSVAPRVEYASGLDGDDPRCVVSIIGCTGDWFGGWDGLVPGNVNKFITPNLEQGRMVDVIERGEPAIMVCHWPGIYYNGDEIGFTIFKEVVRRVHEKYDNVVWMKLSEIARYWAAKELTQITLKDGAIVLNAPYACPGFTIECEMENAAQPQLVCKNQTAPLENKGRLLDLESGYFVQQEKKLALCFDLPKGESVIQFG